MQKRKLFQLTIQSKKIFLKNELLNGKVYHVEYKSEKKTKINFDKNFFNHAVFRKTMENI